MPDNSGLIKYRVQRAKDTIEEARLALDNEMLFNASNRIYYAIFYIVSALALKYSFSTSKHKQLLGWFNKNFIHAGILDTKYGEIYRNAFKNRQESDYDDFVELDKFDIEEQFKDMIQFISEVEKLV